MKISQFVESTTAGSIASVPVAQGKTQTRNQGIYPDSKGGTMFKGKKTSKPFANSIAEGSMPHPHGKPEAGDKITWYHSNHYPKLEGTVVGWKDGSLIVQSIDPSPRNTEKSVAKYRVPKNNILSVDKQGVAEEYTPYGPGPGDGRGGRSTIDPLRRHPANSSYMDKDYMLAFYKKKLSDIEASKYSRPREVAQLKAKIAKLSGQGAVEEGKLGNAAALAAAIALGGTMGYKHATKDPNAEPSKVSQEFKTSPQRSQRSYVRIKEQGVAEGAENLSYIGNCTDDDVIEHIFGDATGFAQAVDEYGDEFTLDDLVVKYDPETDVHSFYYKEQGVAEAEKNPHTSALGKALYRDLSKEKKASPAQVEKNKANWAKNPHNPANKEQGVAAGLDEAVGGNYLYHATGESGLKGMLSSGSIRSATGPQAATSAQTKLPTVSVTRDWGYASGAQARSQLAGIGRDAILVLDRNAVESNFKTLGTSQSTIVKGLSFNPYLKKDGEVRSQNTDPMARANAKAKMKYAEPTAKAGGEFEEAVVVPKGTLPLKGTMVGFWVNPKSVLMNDTTIMNDPRRLEMNGPNTFVKASAQNKEKRVAPNPAAPQDHAEFQRIVQLNKTRNAEKQKQGVAEGDSPKVTTDQLKKMLTHPALTDKDKRLILQRLAATKPKQDVTEGIKFHGGFPDVDHMPGAVYRNGERLPGMRAPVGPPANYRNKAEWARAANRINSEAHDDNAEIISGQGVTKYMHDGKCFAKWVDSKNAGVTAGQPLSEAEISESDLVLTPGKGRQYKPGLLTKPEVSVNPTDSVKVDIPLLIRLLEYAKEEAPDDVAIHTLAEKLVAGCSRGKTLTMRDYDSLVPEVAPNEPEMNEISHGTVQSYLKGAMHDTITGTKDRNPGMKRAISRLAGTNTPLIATKTGQRY